MKSDSRNFSTMDGLRIAVHLRQLLEPLEFPLKEIAILLPIINNLPTTIYIKDTEGRHILVNDRDLEIKGVLRLEDVIGKTDFDFFTAEQAQQFRSDEVRVMTTHIPLVNQEESFVDKEGNIRWLLTTKIPLYDQHGNVIGIVGIGSEFTKHRDELELLTEITQNVMQAVDLKDALRRIASGAMKLLDAVSAVIYLIEQKEDGSYRIVDTFAHPPNIQQPPPRYYLPRDYHRAGGGD
jgi:PAS domain S-box-containing protein